MLAAFPDEVIRGVVDFQGQLGLTVAAERILDVCKFLKEDPDLAFDFLSFVGGVDWYPKKPRFRNRLPALLAEEEPPFSDQSVDR